jgi:ABC-type phosphate transport system auxiliary subunit
MTMPALFDNHREALCTSVIALIEDVLTELGHFVDDTRVADDDAIRQWRITQGSAEVRIHLVNHATGPRIRLRSAVMVLPPHVNRQAAYAHLLALNLELAGAAFACIDRQVVLTAERSIRDLDRSEVADLLRGVPALADEHDDDLVAQFGGALGGFV